jgi:hypothetical protein
MNAETADTNGRRNNDLAFEVLPFEDGRPGLNHGIYCQPFSQFLQHCRSRQCLASPANLMRPSMANGQPGEPLLEEDL